MSDEEMKITFMPQQFVITIHNSENKEIGRLEFDENEEKLVFTGSAEESAQRFFECVIQKNFEQWYEEKFGDEKQQG